MTFIINIKNLSITISVCFVSENTRFTINKKRWSLNKEEIQTHKPVRIKPKVRTHWQLGAHTIII